MVCSVFCVVFAVFVFWSCRACLSQIYHSFSLVLFFLGNVMEPTYITSCLKHILDDKSSPNNFPLGVLTTENRDIWAEARSHLENSGNKEVNKCSYFQVK